jgi:hypothetical protein
MAKDIFKELEKAAQKEPADIGPDLWARIVYNMAAAYKRNAEERTNILDALRILWMGRFASYVNDTKDMDTNEAEREIERQAEIFEQERDYLKSIY